MPRGDTAVTCDPIQPPHSVCFYTLRNTTIEGDPVRKRLISLAGAATAATLLFAGCAAEPEEPGPQPDASAQLEQLAREGKIPAGFPNSPSELRVEIQGEEFGINWKGQPISGDCTPGDNTPNQTASTMMLQDVGIEDVQQCGGVWQATQADGSYIAWNLPD